MKLPWFYLPAAAAYFLSLLLWLQRRRRWALESVAVAFSCHAIYLLARAFFFGFFNSGGIFEEPVFLPFALAGIALWLWMTRREEEGAAVLPAAALLAMLYLLMPKGLLPPSAKSGSVFVPLFFFCEILAHAFFAAAAMLALRQLRRGEGFDAAHRLAIYGFLTYTVAQVAGAVWCWQGWSMPFQWGFRHLHSAVIWCFFANYLHLRFIPWWTLQRRSRYIMAGALIVLAYLVVLQLGEARMPRIGG